MRQRPREPAERQDLHEFLSSVTRMMRNAVSVASPLVGKAVGEGGRLHGDLEMLVDELRRFGHFASKVSLISEWFFPHFFSLSVTSSAGGIFRWILTSFNDAPMPLPCGSSPAI